MKIEIGATGSIVTGDVLDVNKKHLEEKLKSYDPQLYLRWNPKKRAGQGCWELRRRPEKKSAVHYGTYEGMTIFKVDYIESELINCIKDLPVLSYEILKWLDKTDTWKDKHWINNLEAKEAEYKQEQAEKQRKEAIYAMMQNKRAIREYKEAILSGVNPNLLAHFWGRNGR